MCFFRWPNEMSLRVLQLRIKRYKTNTFADDSPLNGQVTKQ